MGAGLPNGSNTRRGRSTRSAGGFNEINITPFVGVMLVLLIMLIITIPAQLHSVNLDMPAASPCGPSRMRCAPVKRSSRTTVPFFTERRMLRRSRTTPACCRRALAGARSPERLSSLPTMLSGVATVTARPSQPSCSAIDTAIGPPIGSQTTIGPAGSKELPAFRYSAAVNTTAALVAGTDRGDATEPVATITAEESPSSAASTG